MTDKKTNNDLSLNRKRSSKDNSFTQSFSFVEIWHDVGGEQGKEEIVTPDSDLEMPREENLTLKDNANISLEESPAISSTAVFEQSITVTINNEVGVNSEINNSEVVPLNNNPSEGEEVKIDSSDLDNATEVSESSFTAIKELTAHVQASTLESLQQQFKEDFSNNQTKYTAQTSNQQQLLEGMANYESPDFIYSEESINAASPMMKQYLQLKSQHRDKILFFRMGDFYEFFFDDAALVAKELSLTVSSRQQHMGVTIPMAGMPYHAYEAYAAKLVNRGYSIAIAEQIGDPKAKGLTEREVVRIFTPGTLSEESYLPARDSKPLVAIDTDYQRYVVALLDVSSGFLEVSSLDNYQDFLNRIQQYNPAEIIYTNRSLIENPIFTKYHCSFVDSSYFTGRSPLDNIKAAYNKQEVQRFQEQRQLIPATGALIRYVVQTQMVTPKHLQSPHFAHENDLVLLDSATVNNLELFTTNSGSRATSFVEVLDACSSTMGARLFRRWVRQPIRNQVQLEKRLDYVQTFLEHATARSRIINYLKGLGDIERIVARISLNNVSPKDLGELRNNLMLIPYINAVFKENNLNVASLVELEPLRDLLLASLEDKQPLFLREGNVIRSTFNKQLADLRNIRDNVVQVLAQIEESEREATGIDSLKVQMSTLQSEMYINVPTGKAENLERIPDHYIHKQTLKNSIRFTTPELRKLQMQFQQADVQIVELEKSIFTSIIEALKIELPYIQNLANQLARLDVYVSLAQLAFENNYVRPTFNKEQVLTIKQGRHPVIEKLITTPFIANDTNANQAETLQLITGPNMGGKSTYMRQNALIVLMAMIGSYVPAQAANVHLFDKILTRIGASDDISTGKSTFMVEMSEMAYILDNATPDSLLLIDEIGRGTSTFDGLSLAWGCAQYIAQKINAITFFSTHYFELTALAEQLSNVINLYVSAIEYNEQISFLHEIKVGTASKSYGLAVAKLAGVPNQVLQIARSQLQHLSQQKSHQGEQKLSVVEIQDLPVTAALSSQQQQALDLLQQANLNELTPIASLGLLERIQLLLKTPKE